MSDKQPIPKNIEEGVRFLMKRLWPGVTFPEMVMYMVRDLKAQGSMQYPRKNTPAILRMDESLLVKDIEDTYSTLAHEVCHLRMYMKYDSKGIDIDAHGSEWRAEMERIGLPVPKGTTREKVARNGLFFDAYHEFLASKLLPEVASPTGRAVVPASRPSTAPAATSGAWDVGAFSRSPRQQAASSPVAPAPEVSGPRLASTGRHAIFGDCSWSMDKDGLFEIQRRSIAELIAQIKGSHILYGYAANVIEFPTPQSMVCDQGHHTQNVIGLESGTSFAACFIAAAYLPDIGHIHIFSDGYPQNETFADIMSARAQTKCSVSTYYMQSHGTAEHDDPAAATRLMAGLARGEGSAHAVSDETELMNAVRAEVGVGPMPFTVQPRPVRNWEPERQLTVQHVAETIKNQAHLLDLAGRTAENTQRVSEVEEDIKFIKFANVALHQVVRHANEALDVIAGQARADDAQRQITADHNEAWIKGVGGELARMSGEHFAGQLTAIAQGVAVAPVRTALPSVQLTSLNPRAIAQAASLMSGRGAQAPALPAPAMSSRPALAAPTGETLANNERSVAGWGRSLAPIKR